MLLLLKTSAHQLRRPSQQSDQPGAKYSRESKKMGTIVHVINDIQTVAATGNIRGLYEGIKKTLGPT